MWQNGDRPGKSKVFRNFVYFFIPAEFIYYFLFYGIVKNSSRKKISLLFFYQHKLTEEKMRGRAGSIAAEKEVLE